MSERDQHRLAAWLTRGVFAAGVVYTLYMQSLIPPAEVFYSCDGGVKFLLTRQLADCGLHDLHLHLDRHAEAWVERLWTQDFYPVVEPFVYEQRGRRYVEYPPFFCIMSAPFYRAFGNRGLYVIPLLATWWMWLVTALACRRTGIGALWTAAALAALIFASPLTLYSAMFSETTLAVLLASLGLMPLAAPISSDRVGTGVFAGAALGLSAWLRPELLLLAALTGGWVLLAPRVSSGPRMRASFVIALGLTVGAFFAWNRAMSGAVLGFQGLQVTENPGIGIRASVETVWGYARMLADYFPLAIVGWTTGLVLAARQRIQSGVGVILLLAAVFLVALSFAFPNLTSKDWGPRYLFALLPVLVLAVVRQASALSRVRSWMSAAFLLILVAAVAWGAYRNAWQGTQHLAMDYRGRILPQYNVIQQHPQRVVVTNTPFVSMELTATFATKCWFVFPQPPDLIRLMRGLLTAGQRDLLLVLCPPIGVPPEMPLGDGPGGPVLKLGRPIPAGNAIVVEGRIIGGKE